MPALESGDLLRGLGVFSEAVHGSNASDGGRPYRKYREVLWGDGCASRRAKGWADDAGTGGMRAV